jgi:hypothetical protein
MSSGRTVAALAAIFAAPFLLGLPLAAQAHPSKTGQVAAIASGQQAGKAAAQAPAKGTAQPAAKGKPSATGIPPLIRTLTQGANQIEYAVMAGQVVGHFVVNGRTRPFSADLGGDLFNDAAGLYQTIATLPFAPGYSISFRTFDVQAQRTRTVRLVTLGSETITVPAGSFDTFKIEMSTSDDGGQTTVWVAKEGRKVVKFVGVRPQLQGATVTSELVK